MSCNVPDFDWNINNTRTHHLTQNMRSDQVTSSSFSKASSVGANTVKCPGLASILESPLASRAFINVLKYISAASTS